MSYGYLEPKDPRLGQFRTKNDLITAIKKLQAFSGLKVTGKIDDDTVKMIKTPRCSVPDFGPSDKMRRRKRYALHDSVWRKTVSAEALYSTIDQTRTKCPVVSITMSKIVLQWCA